MLRNFLKWMFLVYKIKWMNYMMLLLISLG